MKRGELCEVCTCVSSAANCTNRDLKTVPFGSDPITSLDLCENPQLVLIGPGAFEGLNSLEVLILPRDIAHVAPEALLVLPALREVSVAGGGDSVPRNFVGLAAHFRAPAVDDAELPAPPSAEPELALDAGRGLPAHALAVDGGQ